MKLIVGLWNPGDTYRDTRHNLGFIFMDKFREEQWFWDWKYESKFTADISSGILNWEKTFLVKPQTFMNLSGESLQKISNFYKLSSEDFTVVYDDMSMDFWKIRVRDKWSAGWHNGVKSIIKYFWENWNRIKVGVWFNDKFEVSDWVLSKMSEEELIKLDNELYKKISEELKKN